MRKVHLWGGGGSGILLLYRKKLLKRHYIKSVTSLIFFDRLKLLNSIGFAKSDHEKSTPPLRRASQKGCRCLYIMTTCLRAMKPLSEVSNIDDGDTFSAASLRATRCRSASTSASSERISRSRAIVATRWGTSRTAGART